MHLFRIGGVLLLALAAQGPAHAAASYTGRTSTIHVTWLYGGGEDSVQGQAGTGSQSLFGDPTLSLADSFVDASDTVHDSIWAVSLAYSATQDVLPTLVGSQFAGVSASGYNSVNSVASGDGLIDLNVQDPGNQLIVSFVVASTTAYTLTGLLQSSDAYDAAPTVHKPDSEFRIEKFSDLAQDYQAIYFRNSQGAGMQLLDIQNGSFTAGLYRVVATAKTRAFATESNTASWQFNLALVTAPVPEPSAWALMAGGLGLIGWQARRRRRQADCIMAV